MSDAELHQCDEDTIEWDDAPDYAGARGLGLRWFGTCEVCQLRVYYLWEPKGLRDCSTDKYPTEREVPHAND